MSAGRTALVTGATDGIGSHVALGLARAGHRVVLVGRDAGKGAAMLERIRIEAPGAETALILADLSSIAETRALAQRIAIEFPDVNLLVNNAGTFTASREATAEGRERVLTVNHLSPFVLTAALAPLLRANAPARIVTVGSDTSDRAAIDPDDLELTRGWGRKRAYARSKLGVMMTTFEWAKRLEGSGVSANVVHPGAVATNLVRTPGIIGLAWRGLGLFFRSVERGAQTPLHVCLSPDGAANTGRYFKDQRIVSPNPRALDADLRARVWRETERLVADI